MVLVSHDTRVSPVTMAERAVAGLLEVVARHGLAKTTLDDVAAAAGCSRATLYRHFANKQALVDAAVGAEVQRFEAQLATATADADTLTDALTAVVVTSARFVDDHGALRFLFDHEPQAILPWLAFAQGDAFLAAVAPVLGAPAERFVGANQAVRVGEWVARLLLTSLTFADERADLTDPRRASALVAQFIVPVLQPAQSTPQGVAT
ncbi:MAG: TetR/AcrR family transcriptional regulator [Acidimicrobiia bacterium]